MLNKRYTIFLKSKDGKAIVENFASLSLLQLAGYLFPLITIPYLARVIGVDGFGKIAFASAIMVWFQTIADWGFTYTATRDVARCRDDKEQVSVVFSNVLWSRIFLMIVSLLVLLLLIVFVPIFRENRLIILLSFLMIPGHIMFPDWFFQAIEKMKYITILNVLSKLLFTLAVFLFIKKPEDYIWQPLLTSMGFFVAGVIAMYYIVVKWQIRIQRPKMSAVVSALKGSSAVFINNLMPNLYNSFSIILLGFWGGVSANGLLDAGTKFVSVGQQLMSVVSRTFFPYLSRKIENHSLFAMGNIILSMCLSLFLFLFAPLLIDVFFTDKFADSVQILRIMSLSIVFLTLTVVYGTNYLILEGKEPQLRNITLIASLVGLLLAIPFVYYWNILGAAINITVTRGMLGVGIMIYALRLKKGKQ